MVIFDCFRRLWHVGQPQSAAVKPAEKAQKAAGLYFLLNGQNEEVQVAEWNEEDMLPAEAAQSTDSPHNTDLQLNKNTSIPVKPETNGAELIADRVEAVHMNEGVTAAAKETSAAEAAEKPSRQLKTLKRMLNYLQLHYAFSKLLAQVGKRVHTKYGNGYWVKSEQATMYH